MKPVVAITPSSFAAVDQSPLRELEAAGFEVKPNPYGRRLTKEEAIENLKGVDALIAGLEPLDREVLEASPQLKVIARVGIGIANVDLDAAKELGIAVSNTPEGPTNAVAEATLTSALVILRDLVARNEALHRREWPKHVVRGLSGLNVLFIGYGRIGRKTAELFRALGAKIIVSDPYVDLNTLENGEKSFSLSEGLAIADVVTLHAAGDQEILGANEFSVMKNRAILLNSSRGELVNEEALIEALDNGTVAGCWFDAFWHEPYTGKLCDYSQALLTPHACTYTEQCRLSMEGQAVDNLIRDFNAV
ncbi:MAG: NAD(P)-dependent oxidoreductase [Bacteroidota bacterium]